MKYSLLLITLSTLLAFSSASAQTSQPAQSTVPAQNAIAQSEGLLRLLEDEQKSASASLAQLRQLYAEGLIARVELEESESNLAAIQARIEETRNQIANTERLAEIIQKTADLPGTKPALVKPTLSTWSIASLSNIQQFFLITFGRALPTSAVGQSGTHNRLGYEPPQRR
jgi:outer membrane protein TolC